MKSRIILLTFFLGGCGTTSKVNTANTVSENFKDVYILAALIQNQLRSNDQRAIDLDDLIQHDTLRRISKSFGKVELKLHGGYIAVHYEFSNTRDNNKIELTANETELIKRVKWIEKKLDEHDDGEIRFDFGERFYHIKKIIVKKKSTGSGNDHTR